MMHKISQNHAPILSDDIPSYFCKMNSQKRKESIDRTAEIIKEGGVILCPTDTLYGLSCDAKNITAIEKVRKIKGNDDGKSFIVLVDSDRLFNQCTNNVPEVVWDLIDHADSPLTLVVPASNFLPEILRPNQMVAIRYVKDNYIADLIRRVNRPIISTSANLSGEAAAKNYSEINEEVKSSVDLIVAEEFDESKIIKPSKIILIKENGEVQIIRK